MLKSLKFWFLLFFIYISMLLYENYPGKLTGFICCLSPILLSLFAIIWLTQKQLDQQNLLEQKRLDQQKLYEQERLDYKSDLEHARETTLNDIKNVINFYVQELALKRLKKQFRDGYGLLNSKKWEKEMDFFFDEIIAKRYVLTYGDSTIVRKEVYTMINLQIDNYISNKSLLNKNVDSMGPLEFEGFCVHLLSKGGWDAQTTKTSGDQGVDIVATKRGIKCVFQVKKLNKPVGNKAVQEVHAGMSYYGYVNFGFVVTNNDFTSSAKDLAKATGVHLIHYSELSDLSKYIRT